jgi:hypothetical protein
MKRGILCAAFVVAAAIGGRAAASPHHTVTRTEARTRLSRLLGAKPQQMWRAWTDVGTSSVALEWRAYAPHARIRVEGGPVGVKVAPYYRGPAVAWMGLAGDGPIGVGSYRMRRRPILPLRSTDIPASLVSALARNEALVNLAPLRIEPTIDRVKAISKLRSWGDRKGRLQGIWLVRFEHGDGRERLAWMAVTLHARVPILGCRGKKCKSSYTSPLASFLDARSGKGIEALTINGWKPQLPPVTGAVSAPSLRTDLRLTRHFACLDGNRHRVNRRTLRRFHAVTAVYCSEGQRIFPGQGQLEVFVRRVAVSSVSALQRYYERPDEPNLPKKGICFADLVGVAIPAFVDAHGRWVVPVRWPKDRCGHPVGFPPAVRWHVVRVRRIKQLISAAAVAANCPMRWGNTVAWAGPPRVSAAGGPLFLRAPRTVHVCVFRTPPNRVAVGHFVRGFRLAASRTRRLLRALTGPGPSRGCRKQRTFAVVIASPGSVAQVELGGCWRVDRPDRLAGTANRAVARSILGGP